MASTVRKKVVVVGDGACGKTCLLTVFKNGGWSEDLQRYVPTLFDNFVATIDMPSTSGNGGSNSSGSNSGSGTSNTGTGSSGTGGTGSGGGGIPMDLLLWDTAGQDDYDRLRQLSYPDTDVLVLCYSVDMPTSFANVTEKWVPELRHFCPNVPIVLVALKTDMLEDEAALRRLRDEGVTPVPIDQGRQLAYEIRAVAFVDASSLKNHNVQLVFQRAAEAATQFIRKPKRACILV
jgi:small GTP-binding protein